MVESGSAARDLPDDIADCCLSIYEGFPRKGAKPGVRSDGRWEWTVLAGAVLQVGKDLRCISLATGVKVLPYERLSRHGDLLHDSHAEVLARRGARTWLLKRLTLEANDEVGTSSGLGNIFTRVAEKRWRLSIGVKLHLYCSTFPCGDASNFLLPQVHQDHFESVGIDNCGTSRGRNGVSQHSTYHLRTKPGKLQSSPSTSMSCTDKLCLWSVTGMQGSLLSQYIEPIYFHTIVLGLDEAKENCDVEMLTSIAEHNQSIPMRKIGPSMGSQSQFSTCSLPFRDSKANVQKRLLVARPEAKVLGLPQELDIVPSAGSLVWVEEIRLENVVEGRRQGAAIPKNGDEALNASTRSMLSKKSYYASFKESQLILDSLEIEPHLTYYEAKHWGQNSFLEEYREKKEALRGSLSEGEKKSLVLSFISATKRQASDETATTPHTASSTSSDAPFKGWLVSDREFESFCL